MPERTYMVIDPRRDHSIRVPRPDLSGKLGTPDACTRCHHDKDNSWAAAYLRQWYGTVEKGKTHYGEIFWAARKKYPEAFDKLTSLAADTQAAPMVRATAMELLGNYSRPSSLGYVQKGLADPDPLLRYAALKSLETTDLKTYTETVATVLDDSVRLVRIMAAWLLGNVPDRYLNRSILKNRDKLLNEYIAVQMINADHPSAHLNLGVLYMNLGDYEGAERSFKKAIDLEPEFMMSYINLADLYRVMGREDEGEQLLMAALKLHPAMPVVHHTLGLLLVRKGKAKEALPYLEKAASLEPANARFAYVYGVALNSTGHPGEAIQFLQSTCRNHPYDRDILYALATFLAEQNRIEEALGYASLLLNYYPESTDYKDLLAYLETLKK